MRNLNDDKIQCIQQRLQTPNAILSFALVSKKFPEWNMHSTALLFTSFEFYIGNKHIIWNYCWVRWIHFKHTTHNNTYWEGDRNSFNRFLTHWALPIFESQKFPCQNSLYFILLLLNSVWKLFANCLAILPSMKLLGTKPKCIQYTTDEQWQNPFYAYTYIFRCAGDPLLVFPIQCGAAFIVC